MESFAGVLLNLSLFAFLFLVMSKVSFLRFFDKPIKLAQLQNLTSGNFSLNIMKKGGGEYKRIMQFSCEIALTRIFLKKFI